MAKKESTLKSVKLNSMSALAEMITLFDNETEAAPAQPDAHAQRAAYHEFFNDTYNIISIMAFLIGVDKKFFEYEHESPQLNIYNQLQTDKEARIIRHLCMLRTAIHQNFIAICDAFKSEGKNIDTIPRLIPVEAANGLFADSVNIYMGKPQANEYLRRINQEISNRIHSVKNLFPEWVKWEYIKPLFLSPYGLKDSGLKQAADTYNQDRNRYPYQCWLNWEAFSQTSTNHGNILYTDEKFLDLLYRRHEDRFENISLVRDAGNQVKRNLSQLLNSCENCVIVVDCENSDAVKLAAALSSLPQSEIRKISKILLFDSEYTSPVWSKLVDKYLGMVRESVCYEEGAEGMRIEHIMVERLNQSKSQVDMTLAVRTSREVFENRADGVILASSDSDYWAMINQLNGVHFLVMLESQKSGLAIRDKLMAHQIHFCFLDDFCTSASYKLKTETLIDAIQQRIDDILHGEAQGVLNAREIMNACLYDSWISMTFREKEAFYDRFIRQMKLCIDSDGSVSLQIPKP